VTRNFLDWIERRANKLRCFIGLKATEPLDPYKLAQVLEIKILTPLQVQGMCPAWLNQLLETDADGWSAGTLHLPGQKAVVVLNPTHADTRKRATLMEEIAHVFLGHQPSSLIVIKGVTAMRSYKKSQETQAYWTGAAALVPMALMKQVQKTGMQREELAEYCGVSVDLILFREKVTKVKLS
jgi:hypothetical protein